MQELFTDTISSILALGVGRMGTRVAASGAGNAGLYSGAPPAAWSAAHFDLPELLGSGLERKLHCALSAGEFAENAAAGVVAGCRDDLAKLAAGRDIALLCGSLNEENTPALLAALAGALKELGVFVCILAHGSEDAGMKAQAAADLFVPLCAPGTACSGEGDAPVSSARAAADRKLLAALEALACALDQGLRDRTFTLEALRQALRGAGPLALGIGLARGANAPLRAADAALAQLPARLEMSTAEALGMAAALVCGREISVSEAEGLRELCRAGIASGQIRPLLGCCTQDHLDVEAVCLLLVRYAADREISRQGAKTPREFN